MSTKFSKKRKANNFKHKNESPRKKQKIDNNNVFPWKSPKNCISWLLHDKTKKISIDTFLKQYFGVKPLLIKRNEENYYNQQQLKFELNDVYKIIKDNQLRFGHHIIAKV